MKQWTEEDLIKLYYEELEPALALQIRQTMEQSSKQSVELKLEYDALCSMLDNALEDKVPEPSEGLNRRIMAAINAAESKKTMTPLVTPMVAKKTRSAMTESLAQKVSRYLLGSREANLRPVFMLVLLVLVGMFYLGRWSAAPLESPMVYTEEPGVHIEASGKPERHYRLSSDASRRVLLTNVSSHIETSQRLLTLVSNGDGDLSTDLEPRRQMIEELISFNRLYRRIAEQSDDTMLANVLQQMESVLLEISHTERSENDTEWKKVRERLDDTDLLFKLKVTDNRINHQLI